MAGALGALAQRIAPLLLLSQLPGPLAATAASGSPGCDAAQSLAQRQERMLLRQLPRLEVLLLGEIHTSVADHIWQLRSLQMLHGRRPLSLALEMLPAPRQPLLTRYGAGQLSDETFLQQVEWQQVWGHDPDLVLPLLRWARRQGVPLLAINAEPELVRRVRREGLEAIPPGARQGIGTPVPAPASERQRLEAIWRLHRPPTRAAAADLERFIASQSLRDRAMAEAIAAARRQAPERLVVVLIGQGHLEGGGGVPLQLRDLGVTRILALRRPPQPAGCGPAPARARLGAFLESQNGQVWVRQVAPGSAAAAAGIRPGDRILELNGTAVDHAGQVIRGVRLHPTGLPLQLLIERDGRRLLLRLQLPPSEEPRQAGRENGVWSRPPSLPLAQTPP
jgi:uncharacterized iron-regulated protein